MRILALDTSVSAGSVALLENTDIITEDRLPLKGTARELAPSIQRQLQQVGWSPRDVDLVAVTTGPGSFTGLRLGIATAKIYAYATRAAVLGIETPRVLANQTPPNTDWIQTVLDAQRGQLFVANLHRAMASERRTSDPTTQPLREPTHLELVDIESWLAAITPERLLTGPGLNRVVDRLPSTARVASRDCWEPRAGTVGILAWGDFHDGRRDDLWTLSPCYGRASAAEEKRAGHTPPM